MIIVAVVRTTGTDPSGPPVYGHAPHYELDLSSGEERLAGAVSYDQFHTRIGAWLHAWRVRRTGAIPTVLADVPDCALADR